MFFFCFFFSFSECMCDVKGTQSGVGECHEVSEFNEAGSPIDNELHYSQGCQI